MSSFLLKKSTLPYEAPDFTQIHNEDFIPAFLEAITIQSNRIEEIVQNKTSPTFENTLLPLEKSNIELMRVSNIFYALSSAHSDPIIHDTEKKILPRLATHQDDIFLNKKLFERIKFLYNSRESLALDNESYKLLEYYYDNFVLSGANLSDEQKQTLKEINSQLAALMNDFNFNTLEARKEAALIILDEKDLEGLSQEEKKSLEQTDGSWKISLTNTTQQPILSLLENEQIRKRIFEKSWNRATEGKYTTEDIILKIFLSSTIFVSPSEHNNTYSFPKSSTSKLSISTFASAPTALVILLLFSLYSSLSLVISPFDTSISTRE